MEIKCILNKDECPLIHSLLKKERPDIIKQCIKTGYDIHYPNQESINQQIAYTGILEQVKTIGTEIKEEINNSELNNKISSLESSLTKLIGISSNSYKKGNFGENVLEEHFTTKYSDIIFERKSGASHSGDAWIQLDDGSIIMLESKNYVTTVNKDEVAKLKSDMITHHIMNAILVSFNSSIQGMKEMDYIQFIHQGETYNIFMVSNLSIDINRLDTAFHILRKLMKTTNMKSQQDYILNDINSSLAELDSIIQKNYSTRDKYYTMEQNVQKSLSDFYLVLRDAQYESEKKIIEITNKIKNIKVENNNYDNFMDMYKDSKIFPIILRMIDIFQNKKWYIVENDDDNKFQIVYQNNMIGTIKVTAKKVTIFIEENEMTLTLSIGKEKANKENLDLIKKL